MLDTKPFAGQFAVFVVCWADESRSGPYLKCAKYMLTNLLLSVRSKGSRSRAEHFEAELQSAERDSSLKLTQ